MAKPSLRASVIVSGTNITLLSAFRFSLPLALLIISLGRFPLANANFIAKATRPAGKFTTIFVNKLTLDPLAPINEMSSLNIKAKSLRALVESNRLFKELVIGCFEEMLPIEISSAINLNENVIKELILFLYEYNVYFYQKCKIDSTSIASTVDNLLKYKIDSLIEKI